LKYLLHDSGYVLSVEADEGLAGWQGFLQASGLIAESTYEYAEDVDVPVSVEHDLREARWIETLQIK
jgi:hypothetical protein